MKKCFDAGTIQAFLDGEIAINLRESVARHVAECDSCASLLAEAEEETAFAFAALEREFDGELVPTSRLRAKIYDSIERKTSKSNWQSAFANFKNLFANPAIAAFAGLLIVAALFLAVRNSGTSERENYISQENKPKQETVLPQQQSESMRVSDESKLAQTEKAAPENSSAVKEENKRRVVKTNFVKAENAQAANRNALVKSPSPKNAASEIVSGEETYVKTIAALEKTVNSRKDEILKPSARFSFEKDLAVADDAIARMKTEIKQNPKNAAAKQTLLASYQNKVDLLNSVAEKSELMASLK